MHTFPKTARELISAPIPSELIKQKPGKAAADYISGNTVTDYLNKAFGYLWNFEVMEQWVQPGVAKFNPKYDKEPVPQGPVAHVRGRLTIYLPQEDGTALHIVKEQYGSKAVIGGQMDQEHIFKAAGTDALKKCASLVGIGLELYRDDNEQAFFDAISYEDPWTDEALALYKPERDAIKSFMAYYEVDNEGMRPYLKAFSEDAFDDMGYIVPDNIKEFAAYLQEITKSEDE